MVNQKDEEIKNIKRQMIELKIEHDKLVIIMEKQEELNPFILEKYGNICFEFNILTQKLRNLYI